jgi:hypothetical protein
MTPGRSGTAAIQPPVFFDFELHQQLHGPQDITEEAVRPGGADRLPVGQIGTLPAPRLEESLDVADHGSALPSRERAAGAPARHYGLAFSSIEASILVGLND